MVRRRKPPHQVAAEKRLEENFEKAGVTDFAVKGKVPGTQIEGEKVNENVQLQLCDHFQICSQSQHVKKCHCL